MIIDLDSWEAGYADGEFGRPSKCPVDRDQVSYSSGYCEGCAARSGTRGKARLRNPDPTRARLQSIR